MKSLFSPTATKVRDSWNTHHSRFKRLFTHTFTWFTGYDIIWGGSRKR